MRDFIWRFSPNRTPPEKLEAIFVQRQALLEDTLERIAESVTTGNKHHLLLVGPRGIGKTHFVSLVHHRAAGDASLAARMRIARLAEDETTTSFIHLLTRIYRSLAQAYPSEFPTDILSQLPDLPLDEMPRQLQAALLQNLGQRACLLLVENLDMLFRGLGDEGQKQWRAFLQEHPVICTVATSQQLFADVSQRENPFFGFFETIHLQPLSLEEATDLLQRIAATSGQQELQAYLSTAEGRSRVRALHHLAGGNHRVYIVLSEFITRQSMEDLVVPLQKMLDDLTPYYQERLRWLSPQQRQIMEFLCTRTSPCPSKEIARHLLAAENTIGGQMKKLRELGYVMSHTRGRESLYELTEPLLRLSQEVKETGGEPLRLVVEFLLVWYSREQLEGQLRTAQGAITRDCLSAAITSANAGNDPRLQVLQTAIDEARAAGRLDQAILALEEKAHATNAADDWFEFGYFLWKAKRHEEAITCYDRALQIAPGDAGAWNNKGIALHDLQRYEEAIECYGRALRLDPQCVYAWNNKGHALAGLQRYEEALECVDRALQIDTKLAAPQFNRPWLLFALRRWREGFDQLRQAYAQHPDGIHDSPQTIVQQVLRNSAAEQLLEHVRELVAIYAGAKQLPRLGEGLVGILAQIDASMLSEQALYLLRDVWREASQGKPELEIPMRIYGVGIEYLVKQDERVLLDLIETERRIARQALGLQAM